ncbi:Bardet-Biedl syndrome 10 protein [Numida meleagris]|uniref:Bardet-Biedl syndrome 10 protein n=1 Tax=Numida meleagris TaxID=8996 RepID=UPI000B3E26D1|nr:Bardet-Biedl syndrome 10 protein [Numida meleagris]
MAARPGLQQEAAALAGAVRGALGPRGGRALLVRPDGRALLTRDGRRLLEALSLQPPTARLMAACACRHQGATGDGAKTFVLLLAAVLGAMREDCVRRAARALPAFERRVLERAVARGLRPHLRSAFPAGGLGAELEAAALEALLEAYLRGRLGPGEPRRLALLGCELCARCGAARPPALRLLGRRFPQLHAAAAGLPLASSRVLPGILLRRDFAAYCPATGRLRAVLVTRCLRPALTAPGVECAVRSERQHRAALRWCGERTEAVMERLRSGGVRLLLSGVKQHEEVIYYAKLHGVSVVECLSSEEVALISEITGVLPYDPAGDSVQREVTEAAVATFCQPLLLGSQRYVHVGFSGTGTFQPHCLVLCAPVDAVNEQHAAALHGAFTMLLQLFRAVDQECGAEGESQNSASGVGSGCSPATEMQLITESIVCDSSQVFEHQLGVCRSETATQSSDLALQESQQADCTPEASAPVPHSKELNVCTNGADSAGTCKLHALCEHADGMHESHPRHLAVGSHRNYSTAVTSDSASTATPCGHLGVGKGLEKTGCGAAQSCSSSILEAGSVLPVGGYFEILLHYYIQLYAKQVQQSAIAVISNVVADALLSIPKALYGTERNSFTKFYLETTEALRKNQPLPVNEEGLESVYCKYQLVTSVLHCVAELLNIDLIIGVKRPLQKIEDNDSDDDF